MIASFTALFLAHVLADFVFQTSWMVANKHRAGALALHILIVFAASAIALGQWHPQALGWLAGLAILHGLIDLAKRLANATGFTGFVIDQVVHLASLAGLAALASGLWASGLWAGLLPGATWPLEAGALLAGFILATRAGGFAVGALLGRFDEIDLPQGLEKGGEMIGLLERAMIFLLVLAGEPAGIGFLIAAKSVLRLEATFADGAKHHRAAEYIIIGTLASFAWAMAVSFTTVSLRAALTP